MTRRHPAPYDLPTDAKGRPGARRSPAPRRGWRSLVAHRAVVPALAATLLVALGAAGLSERGSATAASTPGPTVGTPVLSVRRVPELLAAPVADLRLAAAVDEVLGAARGQVCAVVTAEGRRIYARDPDSAYTPASLNKFFTGAAAVALLGPDTRLATTVATAQAPEGGVVAGDLHLVGGGDPLLMTDQYAARFRQAPQGRTSIEALADAIVEAGIRQVDGAVVGDDRRYDGQRYLPAWPERFRAAEIGPLSALTVNDGLTVWPVDHRDRTTKEVATDDPARHAAEVLTELLVARGVAVAGAARSGAAPDGAHELVSLPSAPVGDLVAQVLRDSDNQTAELLMKEIGVRAAGAGTTAAGLAAAAEKLASWGIDGMTQVDASGLSGDNRAGCADIMAVLAQADLGPLLAPGLAVAGESGTLAERMVDSPAKGRVRAKTGTLNQVTALAGYADPPSGRDLAFAFMMNLDPSTTIRWTDIQVGDRLAEALMAYPDGPDVAQLAPAPTRPAPTTP